MLYSCNASSLSLTLIAARAGSCQRREAREFTPPISFSGHSPSAVDDTGEKVAMMTCQDWHKSASAIDEGPV